MGGVEAIPISLVVVVVDWEALCFSILPACLSMIAFSPVILPLVGRVDPQSLEQAVQVQVAADSLEMGVTK